MYIQYALYENYNNNVMPPIFSWIMLTLILFVSMFSGVILFFQGNSVFSTFIMPFFFFMGAICWNLVIYTVMAELRERWFKLQNAEEYNSVNVQVKINSNKRFISVLFMWSIIFCFICSVMFYPINYITLTQVWHHFTTCG